MSDQTRCSTCFYCRPFVTSEPVRHLSKCVNEQFAEYDEENDCFTAFLVIFNPANEGAGCEGWLACQ